ncbi:MAG: histidine phosphatase family protein [Cyclobacteriaceae bacterium]|nr:histidine phosphatase family protein [Cyclobacteriaceae bacterium]
MRKTLLVFALLSALFAGCTPAPQTITTFILVRHGEKADDGTKDPDLTADGASRANELARVLSETDIDAIYSTPYKRTHETVEPTATAKGLPILDYAAMEGEEMDKILNAHRGGTVVISGHSNTTPWTVNYFLGSETYPEFESSDFDNIMVLSIIEKGNAKLTWLNYGAASH